MTLMSMVHLVLKASIALRAFGGTYANESPDGRLMRMALQ
jgi:hypothetical protein